MLKIRKILIDNSVNRNYVPPSPRHHEGTLRGRHGTLAGVAMDAVASGGLARQTRTLQRTAKSCGPGAATLASIRPARAGTATVATKAVHRGEHEVSRKAIARGKPGCLGCTCQTRVQSLLPNRTRRCGRSRRPAFPAPSIQGGSNELAQPGKFNPRERSRL